MIADLFKWDSMASMIWQYDNAKTIKTLFEKEQEFYDLSTGQFFTDNIQNILNLTTANSFGLSLWGMILRLPRPFYFDENGNKQIFSDSLYRAILLASLFKKLYRPTIPNINKFLKIAFPYISEVYCTDNLDMTINYNFSSYPLEFENVSLDLNSFFMRPAGVKIKVLAQDEKFFGFGTYDDDGDDSLLTSFGTYEDDDKGIFGNYER